MQYDLNTEEIDVIKDLVYNKNWNFLKKRHIYTGEISDNIWWNTYQGTGWDKIWKQFLINLGQYYEQLSTVRVIHKINDCNNDNKKEYASISHFLYKFLLKKNLTCSNIVEWSDELNQFNQVSDIFEERPLKKNELCNPEIPSIISYISVKDNSSIKSLSNDIWYKTKSIQEQFFILDTKSKYGTLRVSLSFEDNNISNLELTLRHISEYTCEKCGKQPKNSKGEHIIWESVGGWVEHLCKECVKQSYYNIQNNEYKTNLITNKPFNNISIKSYMNENWIKKCDKNKLVIKTYCSNNDVEVKKWNPWTLFYEDNK